MQTPTEETTPSGGARAGAEHVLTFPAQPVAEEVAETLAEEGFAQVFVVQMASSSKGEDEGEGDQRDKGPGWAVRVLDDRLPQASGGGAYEGLRERFATLATERGGSYDEPGDPRPPVTAREGAADGTTDAAASS